MKHPLIIGAGGVASYLLPVLIKTFKPESITIVDKDILEERNLDRQVFSKNQIGQPKAAALHALHADTWVEVCKPTKGNQFGVIFDWFDESTSIPEDVDTIICCADNHMARHAAIIRANALGVYAYIGGNEYLDSQAYVYHRAWMGTPRDPLQRYPNIVWDESGSPTACTGAAQDHSPQLAVANMNCAAKLLHLLWVYERWIEENSINKTPKEREALAALMPCEFFSSLTENSALI